MNNASPICVLIVDDHPVVRDGLQELSSPITLDVRVIGEGPDGMQAVQLCGALQPNVILMDLMMPVMDGANPPPG